MTENYLDLLARELDFDRPLSRCVRQEVEGHLWQGRGGRSVREITARQSGRPSANFGDARAIAAEFAVISLARHCRRADIAALLVIVIVFVAMKGRVAWYAAMQLTISDNLRATGRPRDDDRPLRLPVVGCRWARRLDLHLEPPIPAAFDPAYRQLRRFFRYAARPRRRWSSPSSATRCLRRCS